MLRSVKNLWGYKILAKDGEVGNVHDFLFDDERWTIRYLVVDTRTWLPGRKVLISPQALGFPDWETHTFPVDLTMEEVETSPETDVKKPISQHYEEELHRHYGWDFYWLAGAHQWSGLVSPPPLKNEKKRPEEPEQEALKDYHLRSAREVNAYQIQASDGKIGHVDDFIFDDATLALRYIVVDTKDWLPGKKVLISPAWIERVSWGDSKVYVNMDRESVKSSPEYKPSDPVNRIYEERLYDFYGRPKYWK